MDGFYILRVHKTVDRCNPLVKHISGVIGCPCGGRSYFQYPINPLKDSKKVAVKLGLKHLSPEMLHRHLTLTDKIEITLTEVRKSYHTLEHSLREKLYKLYTEEPQNA